MVFPGRNWRLTACLSAFLSFWPLLAVAQTWVTVTGQAELGNRTMAEAKQAALEDARRQAVEAVAGVHVGSFSMVQDYVLRADVINSSSYGVIVAEEAGQWQIETLQNDPPLLVVKVLVKAKVAISKGKPDPGFIVTAKLSRNLYSTGDEMMVEARATLDCWVTLANLTADGNALVLIPSDIRRESRVEKNETFLFPGPSERAAGIRLLVRPLPEHRRDREAIVLVATKERRPLPPLLHGESGYSAAQFGNWLVGIPLDDRTVTILPYEVAARDQS
ncbi:MAG: DUF4384 domain-containing protein [Deltaproteobacteria bacterium]|nr:DUF4384 domain-containing protein [Deltaproteobacteria bacterium]